MLRQRVPSAILVVAAALIPALLGHPVLTVAVVALAVVGVVEFTRAAGEHGVAILTWICSISVSAIIVAAGFSGGPGILLGFVVAGSLAVFVGTIWRGIVAGATRTYAWSIASIVYIGLPLAHIPLIRDLDRGEVAGWVDSVNELALTDHPSSGLGWLVLIVACTWITDSTAYLGGRAFGRTRLAPMISPNKTVEGGVAGGLAGMVTGVLVVWALDLSLPLYVAGGLGIILSIVGQTGDLAESLIKRDFGIKDMGNLIPGHGGMLDRIDALLFSIPAGYYLILLALEVRWP